MNENQKKKYKKLEIKKKENLFYKIPKNDRNEINDFINKKSESESDSEWYLKESYINDKIYEFKIKESIFYKNFEKSENYAIMFNFYDEKENLITIILNKNLKKKKKIYIIK